MIRPSDMEMLVAGASSKSEKMRRLAAAGCSRQEIADFLGVRYQFVYNVLAEDEKKRNQAAGLAEAASVWEGEATSAEPVTTIKIGADGTATIPAAVFAEAGLRPGDCFVPDIAGEGDIRLLSGHAALARAQELLRQSKQGKGSLVDEILEERRRDARALRQDADKRHG